MSLLQRAHLQYKRQRHFASVRLLKLSTSTPVLAGVGALLSWRLYDKRHASPYDLVETAALLLAVPVLWAVGVQVRNYFQ